MPETYLLLDFDSNGKSIGIGQEAASSDVPDNGRLDISMDTNLHAPVTMDSTLTVGGAISAPYLVGSIQMYGGATAPTGWLLCDGSAVSRTTYARLFEVLGTAYGEGDGSTTFNVPNLQDRFALGSSSSKALGSTGGEETHTLTTAEMPQHQHHVPLYNKQVTSKSGTGITFDRMIWWDSGTALPNLNTDTSGSTKAHNNMPPYIAVNYVIYAG